ncbi:hypothetical protein NP233_g3574 [Leucocoprinus birnbaumii]|uniref:Uncharacterized protein n=1 Tax=Leucocoprinus birnbaumii TaxID=56174 RepID=A0AAD5VYW2_9AGAR|nr:hypothetical protein NP233_g3574 [Leucocoprinus birnbaumii]
MRGGVPTASVLKYQVLDVKSDRFSDLHEVNNPFIVLERVDVGNGSEVYAKELRAWLLNVPGVLFQERAQAAPIPVPTPRAWSSLIVAHHTFPSSTIPVAASMPFGAQVIDLTSDDESVNLKPRKLIVIQKVANI